MSLPSGAAGDVKEACDCDVGRIPGVDDETEEYLSILGQNALLVIMFSRKFPIKRKQRDVSGEK